MTASSSAIETTVRVTGMHCAACAQGVQRALLPVEGVLSSHADPLSGRVSVRWDPLLTQLEQWSAALGHAGYPVVAVADTNAAQRAKAQQRALLWRWLVAGFCNMQVMMYAWPSYVSAGDDLDATSAALMTWASALLTVPVVLFSATPFFAAAWQDLQKRRISMDAPVAIGILGTFLASCWAALHPTGMLAGTVYFDSVTMLVWILLSGRWMDAWLRQKTVSQIEQLREQLPSQAKRIGLIGEANIVDANHLEQGDVIRVAQGEHFAVDGEVVGAATSADESLITGESQAVVKSVGAQVFAGSVNIGGPTDVKVSKSGASTRFAQILELIETGLKAKPAFVALADRVAAPLLWIVFLAAALTLAYWWQTDPARAVQAAVAVLVVTCPCALALAAPVALTTAVAKLARTGALVRDAAVLEIASRLTHVVFDKTGTLTTTQPVVAQLWMAPSVAPDLVRAFASGLASYSAHPISRAVRAAIEPSAPSLELRWSNVVERPGAGLEGVVRWLDEMGHTMQAHVRLGSYDFVTEASTLVSEPAAANGPRSWLTLDGRLVASFELQEALVPGAQGVAHQLSVLGVASSICSGDQPHSVAQIAARAGGGFEEVAAACSSAEKMKHLQARIQRGQIVAMVGDGINDAPVLAAAPVSFSFQHGSGLAQVQSSIVLVQTNLDSLVDVLTTSKLAMRVIRQNFGWAIGYNIVMLPMAAAGWITPWLAAVAMAVSSMLVLANALRIWR